MKNYETESIDPAAAIVAVAACTQKQKEAPAEQTTLSGLKKSDFQSVVNGDSTHLYVLTNANGVEVALTNYGGRIVSVMVPDRDGNMKDVVLGFNNVDDYVNVNNNFGATIGRYGNRIANGKITVEGVAYQLPQNNFGHTLHGGPEGFDKKVFKAEPINNQTVVFTYLSKVGEANFPGNLDVKVTMTLTDDNAIDLQYEATTDKETVVNLTNHSYFNLSGDGNNTILNDSLTIHADAFTPVDDTFMTTGEIAPVEGTPMDFRTPAAIGARINDYDYAQLKNGDGYDHNWVLNTKGDMTLVAATVYSPATGIVLDVYTDDRAYRFIPVTPRWYRTGKNGAVYAKRNAICLETQKLSRFTNKADWPSPYLKPGEKYTSRVSTSFR